MESAKIFVILALSFAGGVVYMAVTHDFSRAILATVGILGLASLFLGVHIGRGNPTAIVHLLMVVCTTVALFAAIFWWYSRDQIAAVCALVATPPAVVFSALTLRRQANSQDANRPPQ
jgi:hypothetical protein